MAGDPLATARLLALTVGAVLAFGFCLTYHIVSHGQWRHNPHGVHLMTFTAAIGGIITYILLYRAEVVPDQWAPVASLVIYAVVDTLILWRIILLLQANRQDK